MNETKARRTPQTNNFEMNTTAFRHEYANVGKALRDALIGDFLTHNPGVSRSQVVTRTVNGRAVCDTIENVARETAGQLKLRKDEDDSKLIAKQLQLSTNERHQAALQSISNSKMLVEFLFASRFCKFGPKDKKENLDFLKRYRRLLIDRSYAVHQIRNDLLAQIHENLKPFEISIRPHMIRYFHALLDQLKCQAAIYKRELKLGEQFREFAGGFIAVHLERARTVLDPAALKTVIKACRLIKKNDGEVPELTGDDRSKLETELEIMSEFLKKRRRQFNAIRKVIIYLEKFIDKMGSDKPEHLQREYKKDEESLSTKKFGLYTLGMAAIDASCRLWERSTRFCGLCRI